MREAFIKQLCHHARKNRRLMLVTGDLGFRVFDEFREEFPDQFLNVGVAEQNMIGVSVGLAQANYTVVAYSIANFASLRCLEQIRNDACYHNANIKIVATGAGLSYSQLGSSHHLTEDIAIMRTLPNLTIYSPCDNWETLQCVDAMLSSSGTTYLRLDREGCKDSSNENSKFISGAMRELRSGNDITIVATGSIVQNVLNAADILANTYNVSVRVLSAHTLKPVTKDAVLRAARETNGIVTVEEHTRIGGLAGIVSETLLKNGVSPNAFRSLGIDDQFVCTCGTQEYLRNMNQLDVESITAACLEALKGESLR